MSSTASALVPDLSSDFPQRLSPGRIACHNRVPPTLLLAMAHIIVTDSRLGQWPPPELFLSGFGQNQLHPTEWLPTVLSPCYLGHTRMDQL